MTHRFSAILLIVICAFGALVGTHIPINAVVQEPETTPNPNSGAQALQDLFVDQTQIAPFDENADITIGDNDAELIPLPSPDPSRFSDDSFMVIGGSSTMFPVIEEAREGYYEIGFEGTVAIDVIGSGSGFERFCVEGFMDFVSSIRPIRDEEVRNCMALDPPREPIVFRVGTAAVVIVVSPDNEFLEDVTLDELILIFAAAEFWSDISPDWPAEPINRYVPSETTFAFDYFVETVYANDPEPIRNIGNTVFFDEPAQIYAAISEDPNAIGLLTYAEYVDSSDSLKLLSIDGVPASLSTLESVEYPFMWPLYLYTSSNTLTDKPANLDFLNYVLTEIDTLNSAVNYTTPIASVQNTNRQLWLEVAQLTR